MIMTRTEWLVKPMATHARMKRGFVATAPECPDGPHPQRDCRCEVFPNREAADVYVAQQLGTADPTMPTLAQVLAYLDARYELVVLGRGKWRAASNQYKQNVANTVLTCLRDNGRFALAAFELEFGAEDGLITPARVLAHAAETAGES